MARIKLRYVNEFIDRHGKVRYYFRRPGSRSVIEAIGATRPGQANLTRAALSQVMEYAIATGVRTDNPFSGLEPYRVGTHHTWTDAELAQFEGQWRLGTRERLAYALLLYTG